MGLHSRTFHILLLDDSRCIRASEARNDNSLMILRRSSQILFRRIPLYFSFKFYFLRVFTAVLQNDDTRVILIENKS
jgi:hypothetical protein